MKNANDFMNRVLVFVDRNGRVLSKFGTPMNAGLSMEYNLNGLTIKMDVYTHCQGNGSCSAKVKYKGKVVYKAAGQYMSGPFGVKVEKYVPGEWEGLLK